MGGTGQTTWVDEQTTPKHKLLESITLPTYQSSHTKTLFVTHTTLWQPHGLPFFLSLSLSLSYSERSHLIVFINSWVIAACVNLVVWCSPCSSPSSPTSTSCLLQVCCQVTVCLSVSLVSRWESTWSTMISFAALICWRWARFTNIVEALILSCDNWFFQVFHSEKF